MNYILTEEEYKVILAHNKQKDEEKEKKDKKSFKKL